MPPRRVRFTIRGLMIAILVVAILLSLPIAALEALVFFTTVLSLMILVPAAVAPTRRRIEAACWALAPNCVDDSMVLVGVGPISAPGLVPGLTLHDCYVWSMVHAYYGWRVSKPAATSMPATQ